MLNITITEQTPNNMLRAIRAACNELLGETTADLTTQAAQHNSRANELHAAAESETDKAAVCLTAHNAERQVAANPALAASYGQGGRVDADQFYRVGEQPSEQTVLAAAFDKAVEATSAPAVAQALVDTRDLDSTGAEWNPELHASTKAKNQDGTWKKRRGTAAVAVSEPDSILVDAARGREPIGKNPISGEAAYEPTPPTPPAPAPEFSKRTQAEDGTHAGIVPAPPTTEVVTMGQIWALITNKTHVLDDVLKAARAMGFADLGAVAQTATAEQRAALFKELTA